MTEVFVDRDLPEYEAIAKYMMEIRGLRWDISGVAMKETYFKFAGNIIQYLKPKQPATAINEALSILESKPPTPEDEDRHLAADLDGLIEAEGISQQLFVDHSELKQIVIQKFEFDYSGYNEALLEYLRQWAATLDIDLNEYSDNPDEEDDDGIESSS